MLKLTKRHAMCRYNNPVPILVGWDGAAGPYDQNYRLNSNSTAREIAMRKWVKDPLPTDPDIGVDVDEGADLEEYLGAYILDGVPLETIQLAVTIAKMIKRGAKLPPVILELLRGQVKPPGVSEMARR